MLKYNIFIFIFICNIFQSLTDDELCIRDNDKPSLNITSSCHLKIKFLDIREKAILAEMCNTSSNFFSDSSILTIQNGKFEANKKLSCQYNLNENQLAWLSLNSYQNNSSSRKNVLDEGTIIAKSTSEMLKKSSICAFDVVNKNCGIYLTDYTQVVYEDVNLLVELLPVDYLIFNINYRPWKNVTNSGYKIPMSGQIVLQNFESTTQKLYDTLRYSFFEKISLETDEILPVTVFKDLEVSGKFEYGGGKLIEINANGEGNFPKNSELTFSRILPAMNTENVTLFGDWTTHVTEYTANIQYNYGSGYVTVKDLNYGKLTVKTITDVDVHFDGRKSMKSDLGLIKPNTSTPSSVKYDRQFDSLPLKNEKIDNLSTNSNTSREIYPNFYPYFVAGCIIVCTVFIIAVGNLIRIVLKERANKKRNVFKLIRTELNLI